MINDVNYVIHMSCYVVMIGTAYCWPKSKQINKEWNSLVMHY